MSKNKNNISDKLIKEEIIVLSKKDKAKKLKKSKQKADRLRSERKC